MADYISIDDILDSEVKETFKGDSSDYDINLVYLDRADQVLKRLAVDYGEPIANLPIPATLDSKQLLEAWVCMEVSKRHKAINPQHRSDGQTYDMWAEKYDTYKDSYEQLLADFDILKLKGLPSDVTESVAPKSASFILRRA